MCGLSKRENSGSHDPREPSRLEVTLSFVGQNDFCPAKEKTHLGGLKPEAAHRVAEGPQAWMLILAPCFPAGWSCLQGKSFVLLIPLPCQYPERRKNGPLEEEDASPTR